MSEIKRRRGERYTPEEQEHLRMIHETAKKVAQLLAESQTTLCDVDSIFEAVKGYLVVSVMESPEGKEP